MRYRCKYRQRGRGETQMADPCGKRVKLRKPIDLYRRRPMCPACGRDSLILDKAHYRRKRRLTCRCPGVPYPHETGTLVGCAERSEPASYEDWCDYMDRLKAHAINST